MEQRPQQGEYHGTVKLGLTQFACVESPEANRAKQIALIEQAAAQGANIICTQELFASLYFCQGEDHRFFDYAEPIPGPSTQAMQAIAKKHGVVIVASLFERRAQGLYHNTAVVIDADGSMLGRYRKMHIPDDPHYYEKFYFTPGDTGSGDTGSDDTCSGDACSDNAGFRVFDTAFGKVGVLICWDQWFPEAARLTALQGAQILVYPTAIGWHPAEKAEYGQTQHDSWEVMQRSHAIANGCFVAAANRVGLEHVNDESGTPFSADGIEFWGQSFVAAPDGRVLHRASAEAEEVMVVECDLSQVEFSRTHWPFLRDRRIDAYGPITKRFID